MNNANQKITTFLMFSGTAEEAMNYYISIFDDSKIMNIIRYGENQGGKEGSVLHATFSLKGQEFMCIDNSNRNDIPFTPAMSLFVNCDSEEEINQVFEKLSRGGQVLMPLAPTPVSKKFGWVADQYGVSWQLNLSKSEFA